MNGRLLNLSKDEYELEVDRMRSTNLKYLLEPQGPRAYYWKALAKPKVSDFDEAEKWNTDGKYRSASEALMLGKLLHELMTDGRVAWYESNVTRNASHKAYQEVLEACEGKPILSTKEADSIRAWFEGAMRNREIRKIIEGPRLNEQGVLWDDTIEVNGRDGSVEIVVPCKLSYDLWTLDARYCIKTTRHATPKDYRRQCHDRLYHVSAAFYERGARQVPELRKVRAPFKHIVISKEPPHYSYVWEMSRIWINNGHRMVQRAMNSYARCVNAERELPEGAERIEAWPDYLEDPHDESRYMTPDSWMIESYGEKQDSYDPFEEFFSD